MLNFKKIVVCISVAVIIATGMGITAEAGNCKDKGWYFSSFGDRGTRYVASRYKTNTTPAYCRIDGYYAHKGDYLQMYLVDEDHDDFHKRLIKTVYGKGKYSVSSYAVEDRGECMVSMAMYAPYRSSYSWSASGVWSPDSTRRYN